MPELAEVEHFRRRWNDGIGDEVVRVFVRRGKRVFRGENVAALVRDLTGAVLVASQAHGKQMLFTFDKPASIGVHLGMTGGLRVEPPTHRPEKHDHLVLYQKGRALVFSDPRLFGRIRYAATPLPDWWTDLPIEVLSPRFTLPYLGRFLARRARSPIKAVLLDQEGFPGVGNWMADEILWRAGLHPRRAAGSLAPAEVARLRRETRFVCRGALRIVSPSFDDPPRTWLFVHRWKDGGTCPATGVPLVRETIGGRTTCWSPARQPEPETRTTTRASRVKSLAWMRLR